MTDLAYRSRTRSVKRNDASGSGSVLLYLVPGYGRDYLPLPSDLPPWWSYPQDAVLRSTIQHEGMWASAVSIMATKAAALAWDVESTPLRAKRARELLLHADGGAGGGGGWVPFLGKHITAYTCTNNGAFIEIERQTRAYGSSVRAIHHLPSGRCQRTGDAAYPVLYRDLAGREHELPWHAVLTFADQPDEEERYFGVGHCAAERAYRA